MKTEYLLKFWGSGEEHLAALLKSPARNWWFDSAAKRDAFAHWVRKFGNEDDNCIVTSEEDGPLVRYRTVVYATFKLGSVVRDYRHDFGYGYPTDAAEYMFTEGNFSCDCNRSTFMGIPHRDCGDDIVMVDFRVVLEDYFGGESK